MRIIGRSPASCVRVSTPQWRDWILHNVHRICDLAEVPRVTAHAMRGLLATITAECGLAGHLIAATLGHQDGRVTMNAYAAPGPRNGRC